MFKAGDVLHLWRDDIQPPKYKFAVCVSATHSWFFYINTKPYKKAMAAQIEIARHEMHCLTNDTSYIDTRAPRHFIREEVHEQLTVGTATIKEVISPTLRAKLVATIQAHGIMPQAQIDIILQELS